MLTRCSALELAQHNIRVNSIAPGTTDTESNQAFMDEDPQGWQAVIQQIPLQRTAKPCDYAGLVVLLASKQSSFLTGAIIPCDGGMTISWK